MMTLPSFGSSVVAAFLAFLIVIVFYLPRSGAERRFVFPVAVATFLLKALLVPVFFWALYKAGYNGVIYVDGLKYQTTAVEMANELRYSLPHLSVGWTFHDVGYSYLCARLYLLFGTDPLTPRFLNVAAASLTLLYVFRIARDTFDEKAARYATLVTALLPYSLLLTIDQRKDAIAQLLATVALYHAMRILRSTRIRPGSVVALGASLLAMYYIRSDFVLPFLGVLAICFVLAHRSIAEGIAFATVLLIGFGIAQLYLPPDSHFSLAYNLQRFQAKMEVSAALAEMGGLARFARITSPLQLYKLPLTSILVFLLPFPPRFGMTYPPATLLSWVNLATVYFLPHMVAGAISSLSSRRWREYLPLLVYPSAFMVLVGLGNLGVSRYRETFLPALVILAAAGKRSGVPVFVRVAVYGGLALLAGLTYAFRLT